MFKLQVVSEIGQKERQDPVRWSVAVLLCVTAPVGVVLLAVGLFPADLPGSDSPTFIDTIFDNRGVIWAARLLLVSAAAVLAFGGVFIVVSIVIRMRNGEWLRRAGPFEVTEGTVGEMEGRVELWREVATAGEEKVTELTEMLDRSDEVIERLSTALIDGRRADDD
jgi:hypothetical protein